MSADKSDILARVKPIQFLVTAPPVNSKNFDNASTEEERKFFTKKLLWMLEALTKSSQFLLESHPHFPALYTSETRYVGMDTEEYWQDAYVTLTRKAGDCEDLSTWRVAELRTRHGVKARPYVTWRKKPNGGYLYHALVWRENAKVSLPPVIKGVTGNDDVTDLRRRPDILRPLPRNGGFIEDPSRVLGMGANHAP